MRHTGKVFSTLLILLPIALLSCFRSTDGIIVVTRQAGTWLDTLSPENDLHPSVIGLINPGKPGKKMKILTRDFYSACSPDIFFDGKYMLFAGRKTKDTPWQIWEMNLSNGKAREVTPSTANCIDPAYLPGNRLVYSKLLLNDSLRSNLSLFTCGRDGTGDQRITFTPMSYHSSSVLADGRILTIGEKVYPVHGKPEMIALRSDGTKAELFLNSPELSGMKPFETASSDILFTERENATGKSTVSHVSYSNPLHSKAPVAKGFDFIYAMPFHDKWILCGRKEPRENFRLIEYSSNSEAKQLYSEDGTDIIYAVAAGSRTVPKKLPSEVDKLVKTGLLLCQDITLNGASVNSGGKKTIKIEFTGIDASYGKAEPSPDGSVYLKIIADMPFRISTLDENGHVISTCNWMSLRPNERRGCTGCHEDQNIVPENRLPLAVRNAPFIIPSHVEKITEKIVELE